MPQEGQGCVSLLSQLPFWLLLCAVNHNCFIMNTTAHQGLMSLYSSTAGSTSGRRDFQLRQTGDKAQGESVRHEVSQLDTR
jgi:hypothetical protein